MKRCTVRLGLSLMVAMSWWVQRLPAQAPAAPPPAAPAQAPCCGARDDNPPPLSAQNGLLHRVLNKHGLGCFTTHNTVGCGSLHSELTFFFGSCRAFFGEPCMAAPPRTPTADYGQ
jgi:hypothetical protein